jgi:rsbT co-antagonist protein RsbR
MMTLSQRQVVLGILSLQVVGSLLVVLGLLATGTGMATLTVGVVYTLLIAGLLIAYIYGWDQARYISIVLITLSTGFGIDEPYVSSQFSIGILMPVMVALLLGDSRWVVGSGIASLLILEARAGWSGPYIDPVNIVIFLMVIASLVIGRKVADDARRTAQASTKRAEEALTRSEQQAHELAFKAQELEQRTIQQQQLLDLVSTLETPVVSLATGVLFAPIVGHMDSRRAQALTKRLLASVSERRARLVILDIAGVAAVDTAVAKALIDATRALGLLGCKVVVSGISAAVATTLIHLGVGLDGVVTARSPQEALAEHGGLSEARRN